eukprot:8496339-Alexandrium_andersonii.AAC.1
MSPGHASALALDDPAGRCAPSADRAFRTPPGSCLQGRSALLHVCRLCSDVQVVRPGLPTPTAGFRHAIA